MTAPLSYDDVPLRADGVQMIGEMAGSGYRTPPALARRADGQVIQLTPLLYLLLDAVDGKRDYDQIADEVSITAGQHVTADNVRTLVESKLRHTGLLTEEDGTQPEVQKSQPLLGLRFRYAVTDPDKTRRLTQPFARLFNPLLVAAVVIGFFILSWWLLFVKGLASATHEAFGKPGLLFLVVLVTVLSAGFHEFGHAAAARRGGSTPGVMGAGIYLVWPAFYTDVTDSYRLGRVGRLRTDLGGLYFNAIVAIAIVGAWWVTGYDALLLVVATQILQMVRQLTPLVRFDGYHVLADITGVPDLFHRIKPTLLGLLPWKWGSPESTVLKPWARAVVTLWVGIVVPLLLFMLFTMLVTMPRIVGTAWAGLSKQQDLMSVAFNDGNLVQITARLLAMVALAFPLLATALILIRFGRQIVQKVWHGTDGKPVRRAGAGVLAAALIVGLAFVWWPNPDKYRPIMPYERGTLVDAVHTIPLGRSSPASLSTGERGEFTTAWADGDARPTRERPQLAMVLVPSDADGEAEASQAESWVFPFNKPLKPSPGDNQALAVNTKDGTIQYNVAFALVWVTDDTPALQRNESYAFASCTNCAAVSIAFQVVLVTGDNHVAAPQNISAAINYDCVNCLTYALATQLFATLDGPLSEGGTQEISKLWKDLATFGANIANVPLSEIQDRLTAYEAQILQIVEKEQGPLAPNKPSPSPDPSSTPTPAVGSSSPTPSSGTATPNSPDGEQKTPRPTTATAATPTPTVEPTATATPQ